MVLINNLKVDIIVRQEANDYCQLRHTIVRNSFLNFIVVELMRCYFRLTRTQRMPTAILLLILNYVG